MTKKIITLQFLLIAIFAMGGILPVWAEDSQADTFVEVGVNNSSPYLGQQIVYTVRFYDAVGVINPQYRPVDFDGFWHIDMGIVSQVLEQFEGRTYTVTTISTALFPTRTGTILIPSASIVLPETAFRSSLTLIGEAITVNVQPLPEAKPVGFSGAVGSFEMSATLERQSVGRGEPVRLRLVVSGTGNVEQLSVPVIWDDVRIFVDPGTYSHQIQNGVVHGLREYIVEYYLAKIGQHSLPPITLAYFDPISTTFRSIRTSSVEVEVVGEEEPNEPKQVVIEQSMLLKPLDLMSALPGQNSNSTVLGVLFFLPPILIAGVFARRKLIATRNIRDRRYKRQAALNTALRSFDSVALADTRTIYGQIEQIVRRYICDKVDSQLLPSHNDFVSWLNASGVSKNTTNNIMFLLAEVDEGIYGIKSTEDLSFRLAKIRQLIVMIDQLWELV